MSNPAAPENNRHHTSTYRSEQDLLEDMFGSGPYDPTFLGYYAGESPDSVIVPDYKLSAWWREWGDQD